MDLFNKISSIADIDETNKNTIIKLEREIESFRHYNFTMTEIENILNKDEIPILLGKIDILQYVFNYLNLIIHSFKEKGHTLSYAKNIINDDFVENLQSLDNNNTKINNMEEIYQYTNNIKKIFNLFLKKFQNSITNIDISNNNIIHIILSSVLLFSMHSNFCDNLTFASDTQSDEDYKKFELNNIKYLLNIVYKLLNNKLNLKPKENSNEKTIFSLLGEIKESSLMENSSIKRLCYNIIIKISSFDTKLLNSIYDIVENEFNFDLADEINLEDQKHLENKKYQEKFKNKYLKYKNKYLKLIQK